MAQYGHPAPGEGGRSRTAMAIGIGISVGVLIAAAITAAFVLPVLGDDGGDKDDQGQKPDQVAATYTSTKMQCTPGTYITRLGVVFPGPEASQKAASLKQSIEQRAQSYGVDVQVLVSDPQDTCDEAAQDKERELIVLHAGPYETREEAQGVCTDLKFPKEDCYVRQLQESPSS